MQFSCCPGWAICTLFLSPAVGHLQLFQNKMTNARQMPEGGCARLELTEPYFCALLLCRRRESNKFADQIRIELQELRKHAQFQAYGDLYTSKENNHSLKY